MTRKILYLMTAMLVLGITTTSVAYAEEHVVNVTNNGFFDEGVFI